MKIVEVGSKDFFAVVREYEYGEARLAAISATDDKEILFRLIYVIE